MAITGIDTLGSFVDTGSGTRPVARTNVEIEYHSAKEVDSGTTLAPSTTLVTKHAPHRRADSPR